MNLSTCLIVDLIVHLPVLLTDCLFWSVGTTNCDERSISFGFDSVAQPDGPSYQCDVTGLNESLNSPLSPSKTPPPLPEKKRHSEQNLL